MSPSVRTLAHCWMEHQDAFTRAESFVSYEKAYINAWQMDKGLSDLMRGVKKLMRVLLQCCSINL